MVGPACAAGRPRSCSRAPEEIGLYVHLLDFQLALLNLLMDEVMAGIEAAHVLVEIPVADSVEDAEALVRIAKETGVVAMGGHVHHSAHTIDLFQYQTGETISDCSAVQGPIHPQLGIAMDMGIVAKVPSGSILTLSLSFNNEGPLGSFFRYICDNGTYKAYYDDLVDDKDNKIDLSKVDVSMDGIELEDREFIAAIKEKREPNSSFAQLLPSMHVLGRLEGIIDPERKAHA